MSVLAHLAARLYGLASHVIPFHRQPFRAVYNAAYFRYKRFEDPFADLLASRPELLSGGHVVDAGAHIGYTALLFAEHVRPPFQVIAFEPESANVALLRANVRRSPLRDRIRVEAAAVGAKSGRALLSLNRAQPADHRIVDEAPRGVACADVPIVAIDDVVGDEAVALVKLDVQGWELNASQGMVRTLERNRSIAIALEYAPHVMAADQREALLAFYLERGFDISLIDGAALRPIGRDELQRTVTGASYVNLLLRRPPA